MRVLSLYSFIVYPFCVYLVLLFNSFSVVALDVVQASQQSVTRDHISVDISINGSEKSESFLDHDLTVLHVSLGNALLTFLEESISISCLRIQMFHDRKHGHDILINFSRERSLQGLPRL